MSPICGIARRRRPAARGGAADLQRAEAGGEVAQLRIGEALVAEDHHGVAIDGGPDRIDGGLVERSAQIDAGDFGAERRMQRTCFERHAGPPWATSRS